MKAQSRADYLRQIAEDVHSLTVGMATATVAERAPGDGADGVRRRNAETVTWRVEHRSLLLQLTAALIPGGGVIGGEGGRAKPSSRPPVAAAAASALDDITLGWQLSSDATDRQVGVLALQRRMRMAARRGGPPRRPLSAALEDVRALAHVLPDPWPADAAAATAAWVRRARAVLDHDVPYATLRDVRCLHCGEPVKAPQDGPGDVLCPSPSCRDIDGNRHRWSHPDGWVFLLENQRRPGEGAA